MGARNDNSIGNPEPFLILIRLILHIPKKSNNFGTDFFDLGLFLAGLNGL
jgi:hypothetical protein